LRYLWQIITIRSDFFYSNCLKKRLATKLCPDPQEKLSDLASGGGCFAVEKDRQGRTGNRQRGSRGHCLTANSWIRHYSYLSATIDRSSALTLSDVCRRRDTSACNALEVDNFMRYINLPTYLLTYFMSPVPLCTVCTASQQKAE